MLYKTTRKLFHGKYQHKIVLICVGSQYFRNSSFDDTYQHLLHAGSKLINNDSIGVGWQIHGNIRAQAEWDYAFKLVDILTHMHDIELRVESPWISIYTNTKANITKLARIDESCVKYISSPSTSITLIEGNIIMPKIAFDYKVTIGKTDHKNEAFVQWAAGNSKLRMTKSCVKELLRERSWGGSYFYITGDNNLLMAKMHLGGSINKIERIIKA